MIHNYDQNNHELNVLNVLRKLSNLEEKWLLIFYTLVSDESFHQSAI